MAVNRSLMERQLYQQGGGAIYPRIDGLSSSISSAEQQLQQINQSIDQVQSTLGDGNQGGSSSLAPVQLPIGDAPYNPGRPMPTPEQGGLMSGFADFSKKTYGDGPMISTADTRSYTLPDGTMGQGSSTSIGRINSYLESIGSPGLTFNNNSAGLLQQGGGGMLGAYRNMAANGGAMNIVPREKYGLGSFIKKAVKGVTGAVKKVAKSPLGLAALGLGVNAFGLPFMGGKGAGFLSNMFSGGFPGFSTAKNFLGGEKTLGKTLGVMAGGSLLGGLLSQAEETGDVDGITRNVGALRSKLTNAYKNQKTFVGEADEDAAIAAQVEIDLSEYNQDMARGMANGGRIGYAGGTEFEEYLKGREEFNKKQNAEQLYKEFLENKRRQKVAEQKTMAANGGRIGYALGSPEQNAIQAAGIMNLPLNQNPAGVTELDLRETGGFIPPVGVKEKADDIPAMLANNEFVFTADAVRGMGEGNVNKGAQRMYDMMKKLEKGGRV